GSLFIGREDKDFEDAPVALTNPNAVKPYEFFLDLYSLPKYNEINPTFFMFLTFPLFFGFMLGDFGYGILTLAIFLILRSKIPPLKSLMTVLCFSSISTIIFGLAYGEFFGFEELGGYHIPHLLSRVHGASELFTLSILLGFLHVNIGFVIGFVNTLNMHGLKHAIFEKASWILLEIGLLNSVSVIPILVLSNPLYNFMPVTAGYLLLFASFIMLVKGEGVKGVLELPALIANILSYARLMAVGLVSVILAVVVNENATALFHTGPLGMVFATIIFVMGHTVNICLGLMSPFIHSMRLHYVEFFLKFYHGGGKRYMPFGSKKAL
ncbi:MAG: V-type ATP synthase subunit I, partial [Candidatus Aenigmarchaeota archaeon]|nr:V-type ATP synthase subunit I [Candidatus Aenigmarchaeota archaeon]